MTIEELKKLIDQLPDDWVLRFEFRADSWNTDKVHQAELFATHPDDPDNRVLLF